MKISFGLKKIGKPIGDDEADGEESGDKPEKKSDFGDESAQMAVRALAKALGIDPQEVDTEKAVRAMRAIVASCKSGSDSEEEY